MTLGSLFDGIAGFPLAASKAGIVTLWASEIERHYETGWGRAAAGGHHLRRQPLSGSIRSRSAGRAGWGTLRPVSAPNPGNQGDEECGYTTWTDS